MNVNPVKVQELAKSNPTAEGILMSLAMRERHTHKTDLTRHKIGLVREGIKVVDEDYMNTWKKLQELGAGSIIYGRKGKADRFEWHYSLKDVGHMAFNSFSKPKVEEKVANTPKKRGRPKGSTNRASNKVLNVTSNKNFLIKEQRTLYIPFGKQQMAQITLPVNFDGKNVKVLTKALRQFAKSA